MANSLLSINWITDLLALPTPDAQLVQLRSGNLWHEAGVAELLDHAEQLVQRNPGQAHQLALLAEQCAEQVGAAACLPRA